MNSQCINSTTESNLPQVLPDLPFDLQARRALPARVGKTDTGTVVLAELAFDLQSTPAENSPFDSLTTKTLADACRIFMGLAYPDGVATMPEAKRPYADLAGDCPIETYLPPAPMTVGIVQDLSKLKARIPGYEFRLGSASYPHLKLRIQLVEFHEREVWVYSVDTHDHFHLANPNISADEAEAWRTLVAQNRLLKQRIEEALTLAGFLTPTSLLRLDLTAPANSG